MVPLTSATLAVEPLMAVGVSVAGMVWVRDASISLAFTVEAAADALRRAFRLCEALIACLDTAAAASPSVVTLVTVTAASSL